MTAAASLTIHDRRRPPAPPPRRERLSPLGLYRALRENSIRVWRQEAYEELIIADRGLLGSFILVSDPDLIRRVFVENVANYPKDDLQLSKLRPGIGRGLLTTEGDDWRLQRRTVAPMFQPNPVASYLPAMVAATDAMLAGWAHYANTGETVDIAREMMALTYDIISRTVFSSEVETPPETMAEAVTTYFDALGRVDLWDVLPLPHWLPRPSLIRVRPAIRVFRDEVRRLLARRRARLAAGRTLPNDLVTLLMNARDPETRAALTDDVIHDNLVTFIGAGHETTANALAWTLFLLSEFPAYDARLADEVKAVLEDRVPAPADVAGLAVTRMVLEEAMRLYPPVPFLSRKAVAADRLGDVEVPAGSRVLVAPWLVHRHRKLWEEPDLFAPERFAPERRAAIPRFAYLPFGAGPRICVGMGFAMQEALVALAMMLRKFELRLVDGTEVEPVARMTLRPGNGLPMRIARRG